MFNGNSEEKDMKNVNIYILYNVLRGLSFQNLEKLQTLDSPYEKKKFRKGIDCDSIAYFNYILTDSMN